MTSRRSLALAAALAFALPLACRNTSPNTPIALMTTPTAVGGRAVSIFYVLRNQDTIFARVLPIFSVDNGLTFFNATPAPGGEGIDNLQASPGGTAHVFLWNAVADIGPGRHDGVIMRILPFAPDIGTIATSFGFTVDDTDIFVRPSDLAVPRAANAAAETADGGVIVAGGGGGFERETELFEAPADAFLLRASLAAARNGARGATLIAKGGSAAEAVIEGGVGASGATGAVALYDEGADTWFDPAFSGAPRTGHTLTRLAGGQTALVAGGTDGTSALVTTDEVIDVVSATARPVVGGGAARTGHTATLLPNGRVLVAGGTSGTGALATTLLYDPGTNSYSAGPALLTARTGHAAALVGGRVLIAGGRDASGNVLASAEILAADFSAFDVTRDATGAQSRMTGPRAALTASPIGATDVLLAGGTDGSHDLASAERFTLALGTFAATREGLAVARSSHEATAFGTGRVLVTGGGTAAAEVYLPPSRAGVAQAFDPEGSGTPLARVEHAAATLADGRVLVTGGTDGVVLSGNLRTLASAEIWSPGALPPAPRMAASTGVLGTARRRHSATLLLDGTVLLAGGLDASGAALASAEIFDPVVAAAGGATFTAVTTAAPAALGEHTATRLASGKVLLAGGAGAIVFSPGTPATAGTFAAPIALVVARTRHSATLLPDGRVLLAGGLTSGAAATATAEIFDPNANGGAGGTTLAGGALPGARFDHRAVLLDSGKVLILGGRGAAGGAPLADGALFDPTTNALAPIVGTLPEGRAEFAIAPEPLGRAVVAGGVDGAAPGGVDLASPVASTAFIFDPGSGLSSPTADPSLARARRGMAVAPLNDGRFFLSGGRDDTGAVVPGLEIFTP